MDHRVFHLDESDHIVTIASAGCNVLDYIIEGAMVTAVDFNLCRALTELKKVAIINIDYEEFFEIFFEFQALRHVYASKLRPQLTAASAEFWDEGIHTIKSFQYSGTSGSMSYILFRILFPLFGLGFIRRELMAGTSHDDLVEMIGKCEYSIRSISWLMDNILLRGGCCLAGVPERQMALGLHRPNNLALVEEIFKTDLVTTTISMPDTFGIENSTVLVIEKNYYHENISNKSSSPRYHSKAIDNNKPITVASLLDHMDWMTDRMINEEIVHLISKMDKARGKIFWRTFADAVHSAPLHWLNAERVGHADDADSDDRVGMYWTTWIAHLKDLDVAYEEVDTNQEKGLFDSIVTGARLLLFHCGSHLHHRNCHWSC